VKERIKLSTPLAKSFSVPPRNALLNGNEMPTSSNQELTGSAMLKGKGTPIKSAEVLPTSYSLLLLTMTRNIEVWRKLFCTVKTWRPPPRLSSKLPRRMVASCAVHTGSTALPIFQASSSMGPTPPTLKRMFTFLTAGIPFRLPNPSARTRHTVHMSECNPVLEISRQVTFGCLMGIALWPLWVV
jgi:hypothetical protein